MPADMQAQEQTQLKKFLDLETLSRAQVHKFFETKLEMLMQNALLTVSDDQDLK